MSDLASHVEWMADAESIDFVTAHRQGPGVEFVCHTRVGPLKTADRMTVTAWHEHEEIGVSHSGIVSGIGVLRMQPDNDGVRVSWTEELRLPIYFGGRLGELFAKPILQWIWKRNLERFKALAERLP